MSSVKSTKKVFAISEEHKYLMKQLIAHKFDHEELGEEYYIWKFGSYLWNTKRLEEKDRLAFFEVFVSELSEALRLGKVARDSLQVALGDYIF